MSLSTLGRFSTLGVWVTFRLEVSGEFLWRAPMGILPRVDDHVGHLEGGAEVETWHKVESVKFEFDREESGTYGDPPVEYGRDQSHFGVCVFVSEIP